LKDGFRVEVEVKDVIGEARGSDEWDGKGIGYTGE